MRLVTERDQQEVLERNDGGLRSFVGNHGTVRDNPFEHVLIATSVRFLSLSDPTVSFQMTCIWRRMHCKHSLLLRMRLKLRHTHTHTHTLYSLLARYQSRQWVAHGGVISGSPRGSGHGGSPRGSGRDRGRGGRVGGGGGGDVESSTSALSPLASEGCRDDDQHHYLSRVPSHKVPSRLKCPISGELVRLNRHHLLLFTSTASPTSTIRHKFTCTHTSGK